jgi:hypothetical protein
MLLTYKQYKRDRQDMPLPYKQYRHDILLAYEQYRHDIILTKTIQIWHTAHLRTT